MSGFLIRWSGATEPYTTKQLPDSSQPLHDPRTDVIRGNACCSTDSRAKEPDSSSDVLNEIASLLSRAYLRQVVVQPVGEDQEQDSGQEKLANRRAESVHGVVP
jgi:hypothetical protein